MQIRPGRIIGAILLAWEALQQLVDWLLEWPIVRRFLEMTNIGQGIDFVLEHVQHPGWLGNPLLQLSILVIGLLLIYLDSKKFLPPVKASGRQMIIVGLAIVVIGAFVIAVGVFQSPSKAPSVVSHPEAPGISKVPTSVSPTTITAPSKPHYSVAELDQMISALRALHGIITNEILPAETDVGVLFSHRDQIVQPETARNQGNQYAQIAGRLLGARTRLAKIINDNQIYESELGSTIVDQQNALPTIVQAMMDVSGDLGELAKASQGIDYNRFMERRWTNMTSALAIFHDWTNHSMTRIEQKIEELREWKND